MTEAELTTYWLDGDDKIIKVSSSWDDFADQNGGGATGSSDVLGRSVWDFVSGSLTRMWLDALLSFARQLKTPVERPYRCDSATMKRFMNMNVIPERSGVLRIEHTVVTTEPRKNPIHFKTAPLSAQRFHTRYSICNRIKQVDQWVEPDQLRTADAEHLALIAVIYSVCADCQRLLPGGAHD